MPGDHALDLQMHAASRVFLSDASAYRLQFRTGAIGNQGVPADGHIPGTACAQLDARLLDHQTQPALDTTHLAVHVDQAEGEAGAGADLECRIHHTVKYPSLINQIKLVFNPETH